MAEAAANVETGLDRAWNDICELGLQSYVADLDAYGYTIIPPEIASPNGLADRMLEAMLDIAERRNGERPDLKTGSTHAHMQVQSMAAPVKVGRPKSRMRGANADDRDSPVGDVMHSLLLENPVFEESLMNPVMLALATYLCGYNAVLSTMACWMKGPNETTFRLHTDNPMASPLTQQSVVCQSTYWLTDFNRENGGTAIVPGSHKWCRHPIGAECIVPANPGDFGNAQAVPVEGKAGSLIVWHGNLWHGAFNRRAPGLRVSVTNYMVRPYIRTLEDFIGKIPQETLDRNPTRFAILTQQSVIPGYHTEEDRAEKATYAEKYISAYASEYGGGAKDLYA